MVETQGLMQTRICGLSLIFFVAAIARAAEPSVTAVLSSSETAVGQPVELQIQITGAANPKSPGEIKVDGLDIRSAGVSRQYQMQNFSVSYNFTYNYNIFPLKAGTYKIPPQSVEAGGKTFRTPELTLNVSAGSSSGQAARSGRGTGNANIDPSQYGFLEMILPKSVAYVGEMVPLQTRIGINTRTPVQAPDEGLQIAGQGFTKQTPAEQSRHTVENVNGKTYDVFIQNTAIAPVRSGKMEVGPATFAPIVRVPVSQRNPALPRDIDDMFNSFFNDPAFAPSMAKRIELKSQTATLEVKPLPSNAPATFSGAIGNFTLKVEANPKKAQVGDPITVTATVTGRGNFDRVTAPALENDNGWHKYPPSEKFTQDDDVGISGTKSFEIVVSAKERKDKLPSLIFSFFDPVKETYVTLQSDPIPLTIEGGAAPAATPALSAAAPSTAPAPSASAAPTPKKDEDILYQLTERPAQGETFAPLYQRRAFWLAQILPFALLLGFVAWKIHARHSDNREAQRIARLQHEAAELQRKLQRNDVAPQEYVADASRAVQLKAALARNVDPNAIDAESAANAFHLDDEKRNRLRQLFSESDEMRYSGGPNGGQAITPEKRREILELVENLR
ncbi:MAG: BatD family protein [Verrucomicrobiota bacterium]|nr:BatD family protein [Verrucomicrobiota bacterium]